MRRVRILAAAALLVLSARADAAPRRVVCLGPSLTETAFALGCGERVVGVSDYAAWPEAAARLPRVGGLVNPNLERIVSLGPDLVLLAAPVPSVQRLCVREGIPVEVVSMDDLEAILAGIRRTAELLGCPEAGRRLARRVAEELESVRRREGSGPRVLIEVGRPPGPGLKGLVVAGGRTFLGQLVRLAGGVNVFDGARRRYFSPSLEEVAARAPQRVLVLDAGARDPDAERRELEVMWRRLMGAGAAPRVDLLADQVFVVPGPRVGTAARRLAELLAGAEAPR